MKFIYTNIKLRKIFSPIVNWFGRCMHAKIKIQKFLLKPSQSLKRKFVPSKIFCYTVSKNAQTNNGNRSNQTMDELQSESDFEKTPLSSFKAKHKCLPLSDVATSTSIPKTSEETSQDTIPLHWENFTPPLQALLPIEDETTYVVSEFPALPCEKFCEEPNSAYEATIRINISTQEKAQQMVANANVHTGTQKEGHKDLTSATQSWHALSASTKGTYHPTKQKTSETMSTNDKKSLVQKARQKKTGWPSSLKLTVTAKQEKQHRVAAAKKPCLVIHPTILHPSKSTISWLSLQRIQEDQLLVISCPLEKLHQARKLIV